MRRTLNRRIVLVILCSISGILLFINIFNSFTPNNNSWNIQKDMVNITREQPDSQSISQDKSHIQTNNSIEELVDQKASLEDNSQTLQLPWYFKDGSLLPTATNSSRLYPEDFPSNNRITEQLMYINPKVSEKGLEQPLKKILMWNGMVSWSGVDIGQKEFLKQECPVNSCEIVTDRTLAGEADLILFKDHFYSRPSIPRSASQLWMIYMLECPHHTAHLREDLKAKINCFEAFKLSNYLMTYGLKNMQFV